MVRHSNRFVLIFVLWAAGLLAGGQFAKVSVILPELQVWYPSQAHQVAWLLTLVSVVGALLGGAAASMANRVGIRRVLVGSLVLASGLSFWQSFHPSFPIMAMLRVAEGVTHLGIVVTAPALMTEASSDRWRGATMALWGTFFGVSFAIFGWFGLRVVDAVGVSGLFRLHGIGLMVVAGPIALLLKGFRPAEVQCGAPRTQVVSRWGEFQDARVLWSGIGWLFYTLTFLALLTILPAQVSQDLRPQITTAMSLVSIATGLLVMPVALVFFRATDTVMAGFVLACLVTAVGTWSNPLMLALSLFTVLGIIQSATFAAVAELNRSTHARTLGYGAMAQTGNLGNLIGTPFLLYVLGMFGLGNLLVSISVIYALGFLTLLYATTRIADSERLG